MSDPSYAPRLPDGFEIELPGRGRTFYRDVPGPAGAPTLLLLHGWTATADLNWFAVYERLSQHFRVVALDHRGHGRGIRSRKPFRLADCADDAACLVSELGIDDVVPVGYSMGGPVAMLMWRRHRPIVNGLVLCATAASFAHSRIERVSFAGLTGLAATARLTPGNARDWISERSYLRRKADKWGPWALSQVEMHDWRMVLEAGHAIGSFSAHDWVSDIDVPTAHIITLRDPVVPVKRQLQLYTSIPNAQARRIDAEHDAVVAAADQMAELIVESANSVLSRSLVAS